MNLIARIRKGETFEDTGFRLKPMLLEFLKREKGAEKERGVGYHHPSSLAGCERRLAYCRMGIKQKDMNTPKDKLIFGTGHAVHAQLDEIVARMFPTEKADTNVPVEYKGMHLKGEADCMVYFKDAVVDFKTISDKGFEKISRPKIDKDGNIRPKTMKGYIWQVHAYMAAANVPMSTILYYNKSNSDMLEVAVPFNPAVWAQIEDKIMSVEVHVEEGTLPDYEPSRWSCPRCPYYENPCTPPI